ncbi:MAG: serine hydrolase domain-containing protein [Pyrinomonadaceae bacterium]
MINELLFERIEAGDFPSAVYLVGQGKDVVFADAVGNAVAKPERIAATLDTIYDLASLTKVLATTLLTAKLIDGRRLELDAKIADILPEAARSAYGETTILQLATHTSGLPAWRPLYLLAEGREAVLNVILNTPPSAERDVVYSDLNFILLSFIIEKLTGQRIDGAAGELIFEPLGVKNTSYCPPNAVRRRTAASELGNQFERETCEKEGYLAADGASEKADQWLRKELIWGEVHDGNAYFMEGVAGHAGLFSTAEDVFVLAQQFFPETTKLLRPETCELFSRNFTAGKAEDRSFGFQLASTKDSTAGGRISPQSFGHLGFTGTSLWIDPVKQAIFILLTNRTHDHGLPLVNINSVRRRFHDLAAAGLERNF